MWNTSGLAHFLSTAVLTVVVFQGYRTQLEKQTQCMQIVIFAASVHNVNELIYHSVLA